ncbi:hypothetical protein [Bartonella choladocola]|uniref:hypothetical protein n=1 Tax=Bartonella choladocola TaxID=2750995 RepID=UPI003B52BE9D
MLALTVRVGQAVQIGEEAVVRVEDKSGRRVKLVIATRHTPINIIDTGIIPARFVVGLKGITA